MFQSCQTRRWKFEHFMPLIYGSTMKRQLHIQYTINNKVVGDGGGARTSPSNKSKKMIELRISEE